TAKRCYQRWEVRKNPSPAAELRGRHSILAMLPRKSVSSATLRRTTCVRRALQAGAFRCSARTPRDQLTPTPPTPATPEAKKSACPGRARAFRLTDPACRSGRLKRMNLGHRAEHELICCRESQAQRFLR